MSNLAAEEEIDQASSVHQKHRQEQREVRASPDPITIVRKVQIFDPIRH